MGRIIRILIGFLTAAVTLAAFQNCSAVHEGSSLDLGSAAAGISGAQMSQSIDIFARTLHPTLINNCSACHGASQSPTFAVADVGSAHSTLINSGLIALSSPTSSRLVTKIQSGHQGFPASLAAQIQADIQSWSDQLVAAGGSNNLPATPSLTATYASISALILVPKCVGCHGATEARGGYRYDTYNNTMRSVNLTSPLESKLYKTCDSGEMPEPPAPPLSDTEMAVLGAWLTSGAQNN